MQYPDMPVMKVERNLIKSFWRFAPLQSFLEIGNKAHCLGETDTLLTRLPRHKVIVCGRSRAAVTAPVLHCLKLLRQI